MNRHAPRGYFLVNESGKCVAWCPTKAGIVETKKIPEYRSTTIVKAIDLKKEVWA